MKCERAQEAFSDYYEGALEKPMVLSIEHHLSECQACALEYKNFSEAWELIEDLPPVEVHPEFHDVVMHKVRSLANLRPARAWWRIDWANLLEIKVPAKALAAAVVVLLFAVVTMLMVQQPKEHSSGMASMVPIVTSQVGGGMDISIESLPSSGDHQVYTVNLQPKPGADVLASVSLLPHGQIVPSESMMKSDSGMSRLQGSKLVPFALTKTEETSTVVIKWKHDAEAASELVFLPGEQMPHGNAATASFDFNNENVYQAIRQISEAYGVIVLVDGNLKGIKVSGEVDRKGIGEAMDLILDSAGLVANQPSPNAALFVIEQKP
jgi:hypothetical protein